MAHAKQDDWDTYTYMLTRGEKKVLVQVEAILNPFSHTSLVPRLSVTESLGTRLLTHTHTHTLFSPGEWQGRGHSLSLHLQTHKFNKDPILQVGEHILCKIPRACDAEGGGQTLPHCGEELAPLFCRDDLLTLWKTPPFNWLFICTVHQPLSRELL